jgi:hypothetical protein
MVNKDTIIELYKQNKSIRAIARDAGCSRIYVYKVLGEAGLIEETETRYVKVDKLNRLKALLLDFRDRYATTKATKQEAGKLVREVDRLLRAMGQK